MGIKFDCPACGRHLNVKDFLAGRRAVCPRCAARILVPGSRVDPAGGGNEPEAGAARPSPSLAAPPPPPITGEQSVLAPPLPPMARLVSTAPTRGEETLPSLEISAPPTTLAARLERQTRLPRTVHASRRLAVVVLTLLAILLLPVLLFVLSRQ